MSNETSPLKYLTLEYIKKHSRIQYDIEDALLTIYAESAEQAVMNICNTTYEDMISEYESIPKPIYHATLMLVDLSYQMRSPISQSNMYVVPYTFDLLVKPYMKLTNKELE